MPDLPEPEPVGDDELLYRKIPVSQKWYDPANSPFPSPEAFRPHRVHDVAGLSIDRAKSEQHPEFKTVEEAGQGASPDGYYVAVLQAGALRREGIDVIPKPVEGNSGHAELPDLNAADRKSDQVEQWKRVLAQKLTLRVEGPFRPPAATDPSEPANP